MSGTLPDDLEFSKQAFVASDGHLWQYWRDGSTWDQEAFSFRLFVTAVDWAGNESAPSDTILVKHSGDTSASKLRATREARSSPFNRIPLDHVDSLYVDVIDDFFQALSTGQLEFAYRLMTPCAMSLTNADGSTVKIPARPPFKTFEAEMAEWRGAKVARIDRIAPFSAAEGEALDVLGVREYRVFTENQGMNHVCRVSLVKGTDSQLRVIRLEKRL